MRHTPTLEDWTFASDEPLTCVTRTSSPRLKRNTTPSSVRSALQQLTSSGSSSIRDPAPPIAPSSRRLPRQHTTPLRQRHARRGMVISEPPPTHDARRVWRLRLGLLGGGLLGWPVTWSTDLASPSCAPSGRLRRLARSFLSSSGEVGVRLVRMRYVGAKHSFDCVATCLMSHSNPSS